MATPAGGAGIPPIMADSGIRTWTGSLPAYPALVWRVSPR